MWWPKNVPSRITSRHHWIIVIAIIIRPKIIQFIPNPWNQATKPTVNANAPIDPVSGQGLNSTKWKGWRIMVI